MTSLTKKLKNGKPIPNNLLMIPNRKNGSDEDDFEKCSSKSSINSKLEEY